MATMPFRWITPARRSPIEPGHDRQESTAFAVESIWQATEQFDVVGLVSYADSNLEYSYDEDWSFAAICDDRPCEGGRIPLLIATSAAAITAPWI